MPAKHRCPAHWQRQRCRRERLQANPARRETSAHTVRADRNNHHPHGGESHRCAAIHSASSKTPGHREPSNHCLARACNPGIWRDRHARNTFHYTAPASAARRVDFHGWMKQVRQAFDGAQRRTGRADRRCIAGRSSATHARARFDFPACIRHRKGPGCDRKELGIAHRSPAPHRRRTNAGDDRAVV